MLYQVSRSLRPRKMSVTLVDFSSVLIELEPAENLSILRVNKDHRKCVHLTSSTYSQLMRHDEIESVESVRKTSFHNILSVYIYKISISVLFYLVSICRFLCVIKVSVLLNPNFVSFCMTQRNLSRLTTGLNENKLEGVH